MALFQIHAWDVSADGRYLIFDSPPLARKTKLRTGTGCVDPVTGHVPWLIDAEGMYIAGLRRASGRDDIVMLRLRREADVAELCRYPIGCGNRPVAVHPLPGVRPRWTMASVGRGVVLFPHKGRIWEWLDQGVREVAAGVDVAVAPDGRRISVLDAQYRLRVMDWPSGRVIATFDGRYGDAGEWSPEGRRMLVSALGGGVGLPVPWERIQMYSFEKQRLQGRFIHRRNLGAHSLRWTVWPQDALRHVAVPWVASAIRRTCSNS